ncbi:MAG TPA: EAL domain-containing protein, partial [Acetobacteraceae bacterium]|nr:EAL domain-containing protein [Acetobacteraceae bacterium]
EKLPPYTRESAEARIEKVIAGIPQTFEWRCQRKDGTVFWAEIGCQPTTYGGRDYLLATLRNIDARKTAEAKLTEMARFDRLTGLANRGVFVTSLEHEIAATHRHGSGLAVFFLDLDHFKDVNDTMGHPAGDDLLQSVAQRLCDNVRAADTVARFGGDEFAVLMPDVREYAVVETLAKRMIDAMEPPFQLGTNQVHAGISIGIALHEPGMDAEALLAHSDVALYRAKSEGRHTYRLFNADMDLEVRNRVSMVSDLREAIAGGQLFLVYQPQVDVNSGRITGVEALVRWRHPTRGVLSPVEFIAAAEHTGLIVPIGRWVLTEACRQAQRWLDAGIAPDRVAVNFSAVQFKISGEVTKEIDAVLEETGLPAHMLEVELTESTVMVTRGNSGILQALRRRGVTIAIDDFGTGYSSLAHLRRFPIDRVKLAQEFIIDLVAGSSDAMIVQAAIGLARTLGAGLIAEGVETDEQLALLKSWGCEAAQGFLFARPGEADAITDLLRRGRLDHVAGSAQAEPVAS